jgi:hypothetical protein
MRGTGIRYLEPLAGRELTAEQKWALRSASRAFLISRLFVWAAALVGVFGIGTSVFRGVNPLAEDPAGSVGAALLSPAHRWDAGWYLTVARHGYDFPRPSATAFFPLYPLLVRIAEAPMRSFDVAGIVVSLVAFFAALYFLHRLAEIEMGRQAADRTVLLVAFFPVAFFFSAIYTESLFLALTVGCVYAARRGWWGRAAVIGALAALTRNPGVLLIVPLLIMLLYGPRGDMPPPEGGGSGLRPRYRPRLRDAAFLLTIPLGAFAFMAYVRATTHYGLMAPFKSQGEWSRELKGPVVGFWGGVKNGAIGARDFLNGSTKPVDAVRNHLLNFAALAVASVGVIGALRRLPFAYGAYALAALVLSISFPDPQGILISLPRLVLVIFPIFMWMALVTERRRWLAVTLGVSAAGLGLYTALFAAGYWVA